jgi:hypothetical protein
MTTPIPLVASLLSLGVAACATSPAQPGAQAPAPAPGAALGSEWAPLRPLIGAWSGTGGDAAHPSRGGFTMAPDLGGTLLVRRGTNDTATAHHEDLTIIYRGPDGGLQASYFDNEGHAIHYAVAPSADGRSIVFLSDAVAGVPRFRLTYAVVSDDTLSIAFEIAPPGSTQFQSYLKGDVHRARG